MDKHSIRWDDLQIVLAIADTNTLSGAGRRLQISHATVYRRLMDMEQRLGVALFTRTRGGYTQTVAGADLADTAARIQSEVLGAERRIAGQDLKLSGSVRVTTTDTLYAGLVAPMLSGFKARYPEVALDVVISNQVYSLSKREADIAIRPSRNPPETLIGRRAGTIQQAVYGSQAEWQATPRPVSVQNLTEAEWIGPDIHMGDVALERWMTQHISAASCSYRVDTMLGMQTATRHGGCVSVLPCYLADQDDDLVQLTAAIPDLAIPLWMLTHPDLKKVARIQAFMEEISVGLRKVLPSAQMQRQ